MRTSPRGPSDCLSARSPAGLLALSLLAALAAGCATISYDYRSEPDPRTREFEIGPLDELSVVVWRNHDLSAEVTVRPDGVVTLPLVGDVKAGGKTASEFKDELTRRYADFVKTEGTTINVTVRNVNSLYFTVSGNAERPGRFNPKTHLTVVEALAMAGGLNRFASSTFYILRRAADGVGVKRIPFDYRRITSAEHANENIVVLPGDVIVVP